MQSTSAGHYASDMPKYFQKGYVLDKHDSWEKTLLEEFQELNFMDAMQGGTGIVKSLMRALFCTAGSISLSKLLAGNCSVLSTLWLPLAMSGGVASLHPKNDDGGEKPGMGSLESLENPP